MSEIVNFNKARKARLRAEAKASAAQNRVRFGRTKNEKAATEAEVVKLSRTLDQARRETDE
jgi:hypothetical protein